MSLAIAARASGAKPDVWLKVQSPHFTVISNAREKQARQVAYRFEQIRIVFQATFPRMAIDPYAPIIVLAVKNEKTFKELQPGDWNRRGELQRSGLFLQTPEKNYALVNLAAPEDDPYHTLFHEYTHLLIHQNTASVPLWLDEGLAEFYGYSEIHEKEVWLGVLSQGHVELLRTASPIPLQVLFTAGYESPYYNERNKGNMFYAESWALTHYLMMKDFREKKNLLSAYMNAVLQGSDNLKSAERTFGDLAQLEKQLEGYVRGESFHYLRLKASAKVVEDNFPSQELSVAAPDAARGDLLVHEQRYGEAQAMLGEALRLDPTNAGAAESMGFMEFQQRHDQEAEKWFTKAVALNSQSYLANYYYAVMAMQARPDAAGSARIEQSLKAAIQINPRFGPAHDALAQFYGLRDENLDQARMLAIRAVTLEPGNVRYYLTAANILLRMGNPHNATLVCQKARTLAKSPEELAAVERELLVVDQYQDYLDREKKAEDAALAARQGEARGSVAAATASTQPVLSPPPADDRPPVLRRRPEDRGPRDTTEGVIKSVTCSSPAALDMVFQAPHEILRLHADDYFKVDYEALDFTPRGELNPCQAITGMKARVIFYDIKGHPDQGDLVSVELKK